MRTKLVKPSGYYIDVLARLLVKQVRGLAYDKAYVKIADALCVNCREPLIERGDAAYLAVNPQNGKVCVYCQECGRDCEANSAQKITLRELRNGRGWDFWAAVNTPSVKTTVGENHRKPERYVRPGRAHFCPGKPR